MKFSLLAPLGVGALTLTWALSQGSLQAQTETVEEPADAETTPAKVVPVATVGEFDGILRALSAKDMKAAKAALQAMKADGLKPDQIARWETLASRTALRTGDTTWLAQINRDAGISGNADELVTMTVMRLLAANRLEQARATLLTIEDPEAMSEIPRRRYEELWLKLEQLSGNKEAEAKWAEKLVAFVSDWDTPRCQSCHANPNKWGTDVTQFDLANWWIGDRYVALLSEIGDAKSAQREAVDALAKNGDDEAARIKLGYALRAQAQTKQSEAELRKIPWSQWPDKQFKKPLRLGQFP